MPALESRNGTQFHDQLFLLCVEKLGIRTSTGLAEFMTEEADKPTRQQAANNYLNGRNMPNPHWLEAFMRAAGLEKEEKQRLFDAYVQKDPEGLGAFLGLKDYINREDD